MQGHSITLFNRGKSKLQQLPQESITEFETRVSSTRFINGNRQVPEDLKSKLGSETFDVIYDMNGREASDTAPLIEIFNGKVEHFIYMSSAGVYKKSPLMPHSEVRWARHWPDVISVFIKMPAKHVFVLLWMRSVIVCWFPLSTPSPFLST